MAMRACAVALWCALAVAGAAAYTVDCNHEYTDCDTELSKIGNEDDEVPSTLPPAETTSADPTLQPLFLPTLPPQKPTTEPQKREVDATPKVEAEEVAAATETVKQPRLLNLNVDELQNFANALHNETKQQKSQKVDLSDVNMDEDDDEPPRLMPHDHNKHEKQIPEKFYSNLQVPFSPLLTIDRASEETDTCKENEVFYKIGDRIDRGCEETCECSPGGTFDCTPRCKHPYIRRGRRLSDPLCFESPVDECCSIVACATGNQEIKANKVEVCRYNNDTHAVGTKWHIGCEQTCSCEPNSVVTCKPRCNKLQPSEKCINVQDPNDECCEVQVCDVSQDVHEAENTTSSTTSTTSTTEQSIKGFEDYSDLVHHVSHHDNQKPNPGFLPLAPKEPIGSVKVLQNNSVQVNLMQMNSSENPIYLLLSSDGGKNFEDVELKYSNLILDLPGGRDYILKTKETGTKFNFTITASSDKTDNETMLIPEDKPGCYQDGKFYDIGEEFHIGCTELCECTGHHQRECVELQCPSHVGLELVSKGCVRWAPSPPPTPPNCCPRAARCLSDGTCHYKGFDVPNWSEVPISLTGCEQRCFCENGELDCQEVCSPLPPLPPQTLRCPPLHRPGPVNISDEDCCKQWGCIPNAEEKNATTLQTYNVVPMYGSENYVTPVPPLTTTTASVLSAHTDRASPTDFFRHLHPVKSFPKILKTVLPTPVVIDESRKFSLQLPKNFPHYPTGQNLSAFTPKNVETIKTVRPEEAFYNPSLNWKGQVKIPDILMDFKSPQDMLKYYPKLPEFVISDDKMHDLIQPPNDNLLKMGHPSPNIQQKSGVKFFLPAVDIRVPDNDRTMNHDTMNVVPLSTQQMFMPATENRTIVYIPSKVIQSSSRYNTVSSKLNKQKTYGKQWSFGRNTDLNIMKTDENIGGMWSGEGKTQPAKAPNPYETLLLRPVPYRGPKVPTVQSPLGLDQLVSQMEVESEVNRNLGRSAEKPNGVLAGQTPTPDAVNPSHPPAFLPTVPPEIHFPTDDLPDYDQNNLHRPVNSRDPTLTALPPGLTIPPNYGEENKKLTVLSLQADSPTSVKLLFGLPPVLVGLRGSVDLRYTDKADEDVSHWYSQVFAPADEVLTTPRLEFRLTGLKPSSTYKIKGKLFLHNLPVEPESQVYSVRTLDLPTVPPMEEKRRTIDSRLSVVDVNDTAAHVSWRHFTEDELQFIDGIQVRYRPVGTPIYSMTELLHHSRSIAELHELRPGTQYEASLILVPPPRATTELHDPGRVEFTTSPFVDPYNWSVTIEARVVGSDAAELTWHGVPSPGERWVRVYRAAHACGSTRHEHDAFRLAARDLPPTILLNGLESNTRCRVWLELFLTNGKIKTSNVLEINTKSQDSPEEIDNEIEASSIADSRGAGRGDYYGALVVVGVVAALGALTSLLLLLVLVRRHRPRSVPITPVPTAPRESSLPPYDNPAYKLELQQETMDL